MYGGIVFWRCHFFVFRALSHSFCLFFSRNVRKRKNFKIDVRKLCVSIIALFLRVEQRSAVWGGKCRRMNVIYI